MSERPRVSARTRTSSWTVPSIAVVAALAAVLIATVWLFASSDPEPGTASVADPEPTTAATEAPATKAASEPAPEPTAAKPKPKPAKEPEVPRAYVEVYNNSQVSGLADRTASRAERSGWTVVGIDNWYGSIPETTVYYPRELKDQAKLLAEDLGVDRVRAAVDPMKLDRLTVILVG